MSIYINPDSLGKKEVSQIFANVDGQKKEIQSVWANKDGIPTQVWGGDMMNTNPNCIWIYREINNERKLYLTLDLIDAYEIHSSNEKTKQIYDIYLFFNKGKGNYIWVKLGDNKWYKTKDFKTFDFMSEQMIDYVNYDPLTGYLWGGTRAGSGTTNGTTFYSINGDEIVNLFNSHTTGIQQVGEYGITTYGAFSSYNTIYYFSKLSGAQNGFNNIRGYDFYYVFTKQGEELYYLNDTQNKKLYWFSELVKDLPLDEEHTVSSNIEIKSIGDYYSKKICKNVLFYASNGGEVTFYIVKGKEIIDTIKIIFGVYRGSTFYGAINDNIYIVFYKNLVNSSLVDGDVFCIKSLEPVIYEKIFSFDGGQNYFWKEQFIAKKQAEELIKGKNKIKVQDIPKNT